MTPQEIKTKTDAALGLLSASTTSLDKVHSIATLVKGINPTLDALVVECERHLSAIENLAAGDVIQLSADALPERTEAEQKRKKYLLLFLKYWNELKTEVARVQHELQQHQGSSSSSSWWNIFKSARGPLAVVTVIAVGIALMAATSVDVIIKNEGCSTLYANSKIPVSLPGLVLPSEPLASGSSATATIPPLSVTIDGTSKKALVISSLKFNFTIQLSSAVTDVQIDGQTLLGTKLDINLGDKKQHTLRLICS